MYPMCKKSHRVNVCLGRMSVLSIVSQVIMLLDVGQHQLKILNRQRLVSLSGLQPGKTTLDKVTIV